MDLNKKMLSEFLLDGLFSEIRIGPADYYCTIEFMRVWRGAALCIGGLGLCGGPIAPIMAQTANKGRKAVVC